MCRWQNNYIYKSFTTKNREREIMNDNILMIILGFILPITLFTAFLISIDYILEKKECTEKASAIGYQYNFGFFKGCVLIKPDGKKILLEQLRDFNY